MLAARDDRFSQLLSKALEDVRKEPYLLTRGNLSEQDWAELQCLVPAAHAGFRVELQQATEHLRSLLALGDPLYVATIVQLINILVSWGSYFEPTQEGSETRVELVAGLLATQPVTENVGEPSSADVQRILDEIDHVLQVVLLLNLSMPPGDNHEIAMVRFTGAMNWMLLRGTSYADHGRDLARMLYRPHNDWMLATYGFTVDDVLALGDTAVSLLEDRVNALRMQATQLSNAVLDHLARRGTRAKLSAKAKAQLNTKDGRLWAARHAFIDVFQSGARGAATFSLDELCAFNTALPRERADAALTELSIAVGGLEPVAYSGLFDKSPFIERPFLEFNGRYLLAIPGMVLRDTVSLLEHRLMKGRTNFPRARAKAVDSLAVKFLGGMLPGSKAYTNLFYEDTELDGLVLFEDTALVVEGKATKLSVQAHRGDIKRLKRDIEDAVEDAWKQGARARRFILRDCDAVFRDEDGAEVRIPAGSVRDVIVVNPTLHDLGGHAPQLGRLRALGLFPDDELPWSININDLRVIAETCNNPAIFLHYLVWRGRLPLGERISVFDEIDLWGSYLNGERFGMLAEGGKTIVQNASTDFDDYYNGLIGHGPKRPPPAKFLREPVKSFIDSMGSGRPPGWREAVGACLDLSIPELAFVCARSRDVARRATAVGESVQSNAGRVTLVGLPRQADVVTIRHDHRPYEGDPTFVIYCQERAGRRAEVIWAKYVKPVSFEFSEFEKAAFALTKPFGDRRASSGSRKRSR